MESKEDKRIFKVPNSCTTLKVVQLLKILKEEFWFSQRHIKNTSILLFLFKELLEELDLVTDGIFPIISVVGS